MLFKKNLYEIAYGLGDTTVVTVIARSAKQAIKKANKKVVSPHFVTFIKLLHEEDSNESYKK